MRKLLFMLFVGFLFTSNAQEESTLQVTNTVDTKVNHPSNWQTYFSNSDLKIEYKFVDCDPAMGYDKEVVMLKFTNLSSDELNISWNLESHMNGNCTMCNYPDEYFNTLSLSPNEIIEGSCDIYSEMKFRLFSKFIDANHSSGPQMTAFKLNNLSISK